MGHRTVVVLSNDQAHQWMADPKLGEKIMHAASVKTYGAHGTARSARDVLPYGDVLEQVHADVQTLAVLDGYSGRAVAHTNWVRGQTNEALELKLLKELADKLGYAVRRKPSKA